MESFNKSPLKFESRAKLGVIVPPTNTVNEIEWNLMVPSGVSVHSTRMPLHSNLENEGAKQNLFDDVKVATCYLSQANLNVIAYGCTAGSMILPLSELTNFMQNIAGTPCITTAASIVKALRALGKTKVALATPYHEELNEHEVMFLESVGMNVIHDQGLGIGSGGPHEYINISKTPRHIITDHILSADRKEAEVMVVSCTDFPVLGMIEELENTICKPVITSNQATFWAALRAARINDKFQHFGSLLREH